MKQQKVILLAYDAKSDVINVGFIAECGRAFQNVAHVIEPHSKNPGIIIPHPLGFNATKTLLEGIKIWQETQAALTGTGLGHTIRLHISE